MLKHFKDTIQFLKKINLDKNNKVFSENEIENADRMSKGLKKCINKIEDFNSVINKTKNIQKEEIVELLVNLHLEYIELVWYFEALDKYIKTLIAEFRVED